MAMNMHPWQSSMPQPLESPDGLPALPTSGSGKVEPLQEQLDRYVAKGEELVARHLSGLAEPSDGSCDFDVGRVDLLRMQAYLEWMKACRAAFLSLANGQT